MQIVIFLLLVLIFGWWLVPMLTIGFLFVMVGIVLSALAYMGWCKLIGRPMPR